MNGYIYLASPYTNPKRDTEWKRAKAVGLFTSIAVAMGLPVYSPIVHGTALCQWYSFARNERGSNVRYQNSIRWRTQWEPMLRGAAHLWILNLPDWECSMGIKEELEIWRTLGRPAPALIYDDPFDRLNDAAHLIASAMDRSGITTIDMLEPVGLDLRAGALS